MKKIGLVGCGYWGSKIAQIISRQGYYIDTIFTSKKIVPDKINYRNIVPISEINSKNIMPLTHLFVLTGPPYHHDILKKLAKFNPKDNIPFVWIEKPFFISRLSSNYSSHVENKIYLDYPYSRKNADPSFLKIANKYQNNSEIEINVYSKHNRQRSFGIVFDFIPHIVSLMNFFVKDFNSLIYCNWRIDEISTLCPDECMKGQSVVYSFEAMSGLDGNRFLLRFGVNNPKPSFVALNKRSDCVHIVDSILHQKKSSSFMNLSDAFMAPVDQNIRRFFSSNSTDLYGCTDASFHNLIYQISNCSELEFNKIKHR